MLAGISTLCFGASYAVALALELSRLFFRSGVRGALLVVFAAAGLLAHTLFLGYRAATATTTPLSSPFDWFLVAAWVLAATYLYLSFYHPRTAVGLFILPLVLALVGVAQFFASHEPFAETRASQIWGSIHGVFILLGTVAVMVGFVAGVMYLLQSYRLKHKQLPSQGLRLPNLEWLDHINSRAIVISALMLAAGFLSGTVLNLVNHRLEVDELPWSDPVIWTSSLLLAWLATAAIFGVLYRPARQGRKVAYLTVASFLFLLLALGLRLFLPSAHSPAREGAKPQAFSVPHAPATIELSSLITHWLTPYIAQHLAPQGPQRVAVGVSPRTSSFAKGIVVSPAGATSIYQLHSGCRPSRAFITIRSDSPWARAHGYIMSPLRGSSIFGALRAERSA